ncbi:MAG: hypothetical protein EBS49_05875 [Verrucomicrobia bacterium]|nr:hypothetical protein [Verrucomicrobiota bacterium]NBU69129.1 hypothetical protein [Verrucomicrobiota bacterium]
MMDGSGCVSGDQSLRPLEKRKSGRTANFPEGIMDGSGCVFRGVVLEGPETWAFRRVVAVGPRLEGAGREDKISF